MWWQKTTNRHTHTHIHTHTRTHTHARAGQPSNIILHRSSKVDTSIFESRHTDLRRSTHRSSKVDTDLRRSTHRCSKIEGGNIAPTTQHRTTALHSIIIIISMVLYPKILYGIISDEVTHAHTILYGNSNNARDPTRALVMYYTPIYIAYMR